MPNHNSLSLLEVEGNYDLALLIFIGSFQCKRATQFKYIGLFQRAL